MATSNRGSSSSRTKSSTTGARASAKTTAKVEPKARSEATAIATTADLRNDRLAVTDAERSVIDSLNETALATAVVSDAAVEAQRIRKEIRDETVATFTELIPDYTDRQGAHLRKYGKVLEELKGSDVITEYPRPGSWRDHLSDRLEDLETHIPEHIGITQPANAGELWWAQTDSFATAPANTLFVDLNGDRYRIWGHVGHGGDNLMNGTVGLVMTCILSPDRYLFTPKRTFEVRPTLRTGGWVSGWTGQYHPVWHADDKWSKCWRLLRVSLTLSTGEPLAGDQQHENLFFLDNVNPVGQANTSEFFGWDAGAALRRRPRRPAPSRRLDHLPCRAAVRLPARGRERLLDPEPPRLGRRIGAVVRQRPALPLLAGHRLARLSRGLRRAPRYVVAGSGARCITEFLVHADAHRDPRRPDAHRARGIRVACAR